jgi:hypothetical protein
VKRIIRYLNTTKNYRLTYGIGKKNGLECYADASWGDDVCGETIWIPDDQQRVTSLNSMATSLVGSYKGSQLLLRHLLKLNI